MKKYIFILLIINNFTVFGQTGFPDSNAIWSINIIGSDGKSKDQVLYGLKGDTLIRDTLYNKLYLLSDTTLENKNLKEYLGGFRQESLKVWFKPQNWTYTNILLYDFSASVGDTIWHNSYLHLFAYSHSHEFTINETFDVIQNISVENGEKKYTLLALKPVSDEWYSGFGSVLGLFGPIISYPLTGDIYKLGCFKQNDIVKYKNNLICTKCFYCGSTGIAVEKNDSDLISVFPNPAQSYLTIKIDMPYSKIRVEIIDEKGSEIYSKESLENPIRLEVKSRGIYFIKLTIDNNMIMKKLIIE
jgi:hypothetical protein